MATENTVNYKEKIGLKLESLKRAGGARLLTPLMKTKDVKEMFSDNDVELNIFLTDEDKKGKRDKVKKELNAIKEMLGKTEDVGEIVEGCRTKNQEADGILKENLTKIFSKSRDLEKNYWMLNSFFLNAGPDDVDYLHIVNIPIKEFADEKNGELRKNFNEFFKRRFDKFNMSKCIDYFVLPGFLGETLDTWSEMANEYMVTLVTDYKDLFSIDALNRSIAEKEIKTSNVKFANTVVLFNRGILRKKYDGLEEDHLYTCLSPGYTSKMIINDGIQPAMGQKFGKISGVKGTRVDILRNEANTVDQYGLIPVIFEPGFEGVAMSDITRCADVLEEEYKAISVVKANNWIKKVLLHYFNESTGEIFSGNKEREIKKALRDFFENIKGHGKLIERYEIVKVQQDRQNFQKVDIEVRVKPFFATKYYDIKFHGNIKDDEIEEVTE